MSNAPIKTPRTMIERQLGPEDVGARGFLKWLKIALPSVYKGIEPDIKRLNLEARSANMAGVGAFGEAGASFEVPANSSPASSSWTDNLSKLISAYGQYKLTDAQLTTVRKITDANLARAQQGLAPLPYDASQLGLAPTVNFGLSNDASRLVMIGGGILAAIVVLPKLLGGRRARA